MAITSIDTVKVRRQVEKMNSAVQQLNRVQSQLKGTNDSCRQSWQSNAGTAFQRKADELASDLSRTISSIQKLTNTIQQTADRIEREDAERARLLSA